MDAFGHCVGLAATQLGEMVRIVVVDVSGHRKAASSNGRLVLVNPRIVARRGSRGRPRGLPEHPRADRERAPGDADRGRGRRPAHRLRGLRGPLPAARDRPPRRPALPRPRRLAHCGCVQAGTHAPDARDGHRRVGWARDAARGGGRGAAREPGLRAHPQPRGRRQPRRHEDPRGQARGRLPLRLPADPGLGRRRHGREGRPGGHDVPPRRRGVRLLPPPPPAVRHLRRVHRGARRVRRPQAASRCPGRRPPRSRSPA